MALYLAGLIAAGRRLLGSVDFLKVAAALALVALGFIAPGLAPWAAAAVVTGVLAGVCVGEAFPLGSAR